MSIIVNIIDTEKKGSELENNIKELEELFSNTEIFDICHNGSKHDENRFVLNVKSSAKCLISGDELEYILEELKEIKGWIICGLGTIKSCEKGVYFDKVYKYELEEAEFMNMFVYFCAPANDKYKEGKSIFFSNCLFAFYDNGPINRDKVCLLNDKTIVIKETNESQSAFWIVIFIILVILFLYAIMRNNH